MIFALWDKFLALPAGIRNVAFALIAAGLAVVAFLLWLDHVKDEAVEADRAKAHAEIAEREAQAVASAAAVAAVQSATIAQGNERARAVAAKSDDPLADGLRALK